mgnify:CR=1 FL=1
MLTKLNLKSWVMTMMLILMEVQTMMFGTFTTDGTNYILVTDAGTDSLYLFQSNGNEGVNPPVGSSEVKTIKLN